MKRRLASALTVAGAVATAMLGIDLGACSTESALDGMPTWSCFLWPTMDAIESRVVRRQR